MLRQRRGKWFDPVLVDLVLAHAGNSKLWRQLGEITHPEHVGYLDPEARIIPSTSMDDMIRIGEVFAAAVDAKSPWTTNHSTRTAALGRLMAETMNFTPLEQDRVGLAGPFTIWASWRSATPSWTRPARCFRRRWRKCSGTLRSPMTS